MTAAGLNMKVHIWRLTTGDDDIVGGANVTGSILYYNIHARIDEKSPEQFLMQPGYETSRVLTAILIPVTLQIKEKDELQVIKPLDSVYYGKRFRILGVRPASHSTRDPRNYLILDMVRTEYSHAIQ